MDAKAIRTAVGTALAAVAVSAAVLTGTPVTAMADPVGEVPLYYLENPYTEEGFFTTDRNERDVIRDSGWTYKWVTLYVPTESDSPVYRLYNPNNDDHLYTRDYNEYETLPQFGWRQEGVQFYSVPEDDAADDAAMYRIYNEHVTGQGAHVYSTDYSWAVSQERSGWRFEGANWYGLRRPSGDAERYQGTWYGGRQWPDLDQSQTVDPDPDVPDVTPGEGRQDVLAYAREQIGWPYVAAGESYEEGGFDCSGLTYFVYKHFGVELPRTTWGQQVWLQNHGTWTTDITKLKPGDLIVMEWGGHVGIFVGRDPVTGRYMMIDAPHYGERVQEREIVAYYYNRGFLGGGSVL